MSSRTVSKSKSVQGNTDLTLVAPITQGLVDTVPPCTYATRLRTVLQTLHVLQATSREYAPIRPFTDTVERIRAIQSFRLAILEPEQRLVLALAFDSGWEPYMRTVWSKLGPLLDLLLCNCDGYVTAHGNTFADYTDWVRRAQIETGLFYNAAPLTVDDLQYLRQAERLHERGPANSATDLAAARMVVASPASVAQAAATLDPGGVADRLALGALAALYGLAAMYPPGSLTGDGEILLRAARLMLDDIGDTATRFPAGSAGRQLFGQQLDWFEQGPVVASTPVPAAAGPFSAASDAQGGILTGYEATHGALLLIAFDHQASAQAFLASLEVTSEEHAVATAGHVDEIYTNIAFTHEGLRQLGLSDRELNAFSQEFREGMEARSSILGDVHCNHPLNWTLPERNWTPAGARSVVQLSMVHAMVQLSVRSAAVAGDHEVVDNPSHPLFQRITALAGRLQAQLLSVQSMRRHTKPGESSPRDHFGFVDGLSQPDIVDSAGGAVGEPWTNRTARGELLLGYPNDHGDPPPPDENPLVAGGLWANGTYLVIRKLSQDVAALGRVLDLGSTRCSLAADDIKAKMMGRTLNGTPLVSGTTSSNNSFDYRHDDLGEQCPFQAHIRRANPRDARERPVPRIVRRGMSYGPRYADLENADRGLVFMAYNARIAEQFEVIQRWLAGGNSSGAFSGQSDPFVGVPQPGDPRTFRFQDAGSVLRMDLDDPSGRPLVTLRWGAYLFVPSITALGALSGRAKTPQQADVPWSPEAGEQVIQRLVALQERGTPDVQVHWKAVLEDPAARLSRTTASVWAAIRENHDGVLRTPVGVLVGSYNHVMQVLRDADGLYSVRGYAERMRDSFGEAYLGLDEGPEYEAQSAAVNRALMNVPEADAFTLARTTTQQLLGFAVERARQYFAAQHAPVWELTLDMGDICDQVLSVLCASWFGIGDGKPELPAGGWRWGWEPPDTAPPRCPGHFLAPARFLFQPDPGPMERQFGIAHGRVLRDAFQELVSRGRKSAPSGPLAKALFNAFPDASQNDLLVRTLIGVLVGFLPVVGGSLRACVFEWIQDGTLWELQGAFPTAGEPSYDDVRGLLEDRLRRTMQRSPVPEMVWRTAVSPHALGAVDVQSGDRILVGLGSAAQEALQAGTTDCVPLFGGDRRVVPHPTHACPAYAMGMGVLLGMLAATISSRPKRPSPGPLALTWGGAVS